LLKAAEEKKVKCVGGAIKLCLQGESAKRDLKPWVRVMFSCTQDLKVGFFYDVKRVPGAGNMLVHRDVFDQIGMFRTDLVEGGEDTDLFHRMREVGCQAYYTPDAVVHHLVPEHRLEPKYIRPASLRMGAHIARREYNDYNRIAFPFIIIARAGQTALVHGSRLLYAIIGGDKEAILERQCKWWLGQGYLRSAMRFLIYQEAAVSTLKFRNERKTAGST